MRKLLIYTSIILLFFILSCSDQTNSNEPVAVNGILDLRDWDFHKNGPVPLRGEWKYRWMDDDNRYKSPSFDDSEWDTIKIPGNLNKTTESPYGFAWLRLKILLKQNPEAFKQKNLGIEQILDMHSAYEMYINGQPVLKAGKTGTSHKEEVPDYNPGIRPIAKDYLTDELVVSIKASNYNFIIGGFIGPPRMGLLESLQRDLFKKNTLNFILFGILVMMIIYHLLLWMARREDRASLYFALFCFGPLFRLIYISTIPREIFFAFDHFNLHHQFSFLSIPIILIFTPTFYASLFPDEFSTKLLRFFQITGVISFIFIAFTHVRTFSEYMIHYEITLFILLIWVTIALIIAFIRRRETAWLILLGMIIVFATVINDVLFSLQIINTGFYSHSGFIVLVLSQSTALSLRFANAYKTAEHLTDNLQREVDRKTGDLKKRTVEAEEANRKLKEMDNFKNIFFQNVTHELRTPLTLIIGHIENVLHESEYSNQINLKRRHETVLNNARRLLRLINQLLDISKIDSKMMKLKAEKIDIIKMLQYITASFESIAHKKKIKYNTTYERERIISSFDREKIEKVFYNILSNAFKFTGENGYISLTITVMDQSVIIIIEDNGIGIPEEMLPNIFDRFYQADGSSTREHEGTGIGLSLVKEYIEMHKGTINVASSEKKGTVFTIQIPLDESFEDENNLESSDIDINVQNQRQAIYMSDIETADFDITKDETVNYIIIPDEDKKCILVIDDNKDMREYIKDILIDKFHIYEANNGLKGLEVLKTTTPDLIITDVMMPKMDGNQLLSHLKENKETSHIPVIMLTAKASLDERIKGLEAGADDYLSKPFDARELLSRINSILKIYEYQKIIVERNKEIEIELDLARQIQTRLLPDQEIKDKNFNYYAVYIPMDKVAGDFYDFKSTDEETKIYVADVSGHGIAAAFLALITKIEFNNIISISDATNTALLHIHEVISQYTVRSNFVTAFYCIIDNTTKEMRYCCAGHHYPLLYRAGTNSVLELKGKGAALGIFNSINLVEETIQLESGDRIFLYTDGITECFNESNVMFGEKNLIDFILNNNQYNPQDFSEMLLQVLKEFNGSEEFEDDVTLLVIDVP